jgi:hypothetical protein
MFGFWSNVVDFNIEKVKKKVVVKIGQKLVDN